MEKTSLKLVFFFFLIVSLCDAREMAKEEVNCIDQKCPEGKKNCNCLPLVAHIMKETKKLCETDHDCMRYCPRECKPGTCVCACNFGCTCTC